MLPLLLEKDKKAIKFLKTIMFFCLAIFGIILIMYKPHKYTPQEYISCVWHNDSIRIVQYNSDIAEEFIRTNLSTRKINYEIWNDEYDDDAQCYIITYKLLTEDKTHYTNKIKAYVKVSFASNNGNYIIKPKLIKEVDITDN